jgi:hypothetical protein
MRGADDSGDNNGEHQRPAAKIVMEVHRKGAAGAQQEQGREREPCSLLLVLDVTYDRFAYMGDKVIERPVFFLARVKFAFQFGLVVLVRFPQRRLVYFRDCHFISLPPNGPYRVDTRSVVSLPHVVH